MAIAVAARSPALAIRSRQHEVRSHFWLRCLVGATMVLGVAWRLIRYFLQFPIWGDEAFICLNFPENTFSGLTGELRYAQVSPIFFMWGEFLAYNWLGASELALRLLPLVAGLGGLGLFWAAARTTLPRTPALLSVALLAVSYAPVRHACEVKPYSFDLFFATLLLFPAVKWLRHPERIGWLLMLAAATPIAMASSYPAVFIGGAISITLLPSVWRRTGSAAKAWFLVYNVFLVGAFWAHYQLIGRQQMALADQRVETYLQEYWQQWLPAWNLETICRWLWASHTGNMMAYPIGASHGASVGTFLLCVLGGIALWRSGRKQLFALVVLPFLLSMVAALLHKYPYGGSARLAQHLAPFICLLAGSGMAALVRAGSRLVLVSQDASGTKLLGTVYVALAACAITGIARDILKPYKTEGEIWTRGFVEILASKAQAGDEVVICSSDSVKPTMRWYLAQHPEFHLQAGVNWSQPPPATGRVWMVHPSLGNAPPNIGPPGWTLTGEERTRIPQEQPDRPAEFAFVQLWRRP